MSGQELITYEEKYQSLSKLAETAFDVADGTLTNLPEEEEDWLGVKVVEIISKPTYDDVKSGEQYEKSTTAMIREKALDLTMSDYTRFQNEGSYGLGENRMRDHIRSHTLYAIELSNSGHSPFSMTQTRLYQNELKLMRDHGHDITRLPDGNRRFGLYK